ncbi:MAG: threonylcarbamoyl-AMP synthase, partial [Oscillospiraceae bacterium]|nr:threonylcarbamoyl-AMP synthase [Oscillospiraceae bacterium]
MKTLILRAGHGIEHAADILKRGGICIIPTETVYGLACDATNTAALARLRHLKGRQPDKPFSILMSAPPRGIGADIDRLAGVYMPGPLTLVLPRAALEAAIDTGAAANLVDAVASPMSLDSSATSDSIGMRVPADSIGVRVPSHDTTLSLLRVCGFPLAAPSANRAGEAPPVTFEDALRRFDGMIECAIDGGDCARGVESTVLDMTQPTPRMLRRGAITKRAIE